MKYPCLPAWGCVPLAADGRLAAAVPADFKASGRVVWRENDFPYSFEAGIEHHNIWSSAPLPEAEVEAVIAERRPEGEWDALWFVNPPVLMSVPLVSGPGPCFTSSPTAARDADSSLPRRPAADLARARPLAEKTSAGRRRLTRPEQPLSQAATFNF